MKLKIALEEEPISFEDINNILHALKGLLFQLGNYPAAEKMNEIRSDVKGHKSLEELALLLDL